MTDKKIHREMVPSGIYQMLMAKVYESYAENEEKNKRRRTGKIHEYRREYHYTSTYI